MAEQHHLLPPAYIVTMESREDNDDSCARRFVDGWRRRRPCRCCSNGCQAGQEAFLGVYFKYDFPIHIVLAIIVAYLYPPLGAVYVQPDVTSSIAAVVLVFVIVGLGLKTSDLAAACCRRVAFNVFVQLYNFFFASALVVSVCRVLIRLHLLNEALGTGMMICSCLPIAINALIVLTAAAGGDEAVAVFNTVASNMIGIFLSPVLILLFLGSSTPGAETPLDNNPLLSVHGVFSDLFWIVVLPMLVGWFLHNYVEPANRLYVHHKRRFKKAQESCLVFIVYCTFCRKWLASADDGGGANDAEIAATTAGMSEVVFMILLEAVLMATLMGIAWLSLEYLFPREPELRVTGLFACHNRTIALGVPLIGSLYKGHPDLALYTLPILVWHPLQLVVGSMLAPALHSYIRRERAHLIATSSSSLGAINNSCKTVDDGSAQGEENETDSWTEATGLLPEDASSRSSTPPQTYAGANHTYGSIHAINV
jgi:solute carrier family 10 (sodium/bile acid cotransporter), member 7